MPGIERRILFVNHWAARLGGAEHSLLDILAEAVRRPGIRPFLVTAEEGVLVERARALGVAVRIVPCSASLGALRRGTLSLPSLLMQWRGLLSFLRYVLGVRAVIAQVKPDIVHANVPKSHMTLLLLARLGYGGRCCCHLREIFEEGSVPWRLYAFLLRPRTSFVLAISQAVRDSLPSRLRDVTIVAYNGVAICPRQEASADEGPLRFLYLGRVVPWKGCHLLIEAFHRLRQRRGMEAGTLDIIGDTLYWSPSYRRELEGLIARLGCEDFCRLLPHTPNPIETMGSYDVFCIASDREPFGRVVAEAQGCGLPIIGFDSGGLPEIVDREKTGFLVPPGDVEAFSLAMERFVDDKDLVRFMGSAGHDRAVRLFNRDVRIPAIVDALIKNIENRVP